MATLVIVGIDGSGKDHVANVIVDHTGWSRQRGWFSGRARQERTTETKRRSRLAAEQVFLTTLPMTRHILPFAVGVLARADARQDTSPRSTVLVSWTPLRLAALAHAAGSTRIPRLTDRLMRAALLRRDARAIVVRASPHTISARLSQRRTGGRADRFDEFLDADEGFARRFDDALTVLTSRWFPTIEFDNDDASDEDIIAGTGVFRPSGTDLS